jgi:hypothetical protein
MLFFSWNPSTRSLISEAGATFVSNGMDAPVKRHRVCQSGRCDTNHYKQRSVQDEGYGDWD